jgi:hypothetical protein
MLLRFWHENLRLHFHLGTCPVLQQTSQSKDCVRRGGGGGWWRGIGGSRRATPPEPCAAQPFHISLKCRSSWSSKQKKYIELGPLFRAFHKVHIGIYSEETTTFKKKSSSFFVWHCTTNSYLRFKLFLNFDCTWQKVTLEFLYYRRQQKFEKHSPSFLFEIAFKRFGHLRIYEF